MDGHITPDEIDVEELEERDETPTWHKIIAVTASFLLITYVTFDAQVRSVVTGWTETAEYERKTFYHENTTITFTSDTWKTLQDMWDNVRTREFRLCLQGHVDADTYRVSHITEPRVSHSSVYHVSSAPCPEDTVVDLHSHPPRQCVASQADIHHLRHVQNDNPDVLLAVMCGDDRMSFYS